MSAKQLTTTYRAAVVVTAGDPFSLVLHLSLLLLLALLAAIPGFTYGEHLKLLRDQCLALLLLIGALAIAFGCVRAVTDDLRRGAGEILMSRPIGNGCLLGGKILGVLTTALLLHASGLLAYLWMSEVAHDPEHLNLTSLGLYLAVVTAAVIAAGLRHYVVGGSFSLAANIAVAAGLTLVFVIRACGRGGPYDWTGLQGGLLLAFAVIGFAAMVLPLAVLMDSVLVLCGAVVLFFAGLFSEYLISAWGAGGELLQTLLRAVLPNWQTYWVSDRLSAGEFVPAAYLMHSGLQAGLQLLLFLTVATLLLDRTEVRGQA